MSLFRRLAATLLVAVLCSPALAATPSVDNLTPSRGRVGGWSSVIITGTHLESTSAVRFGDLDAVSLSVDGSGRRIEASTPMHAPGTVAVELVTAQGVVAAGSYTFVPQPTITNLSPFEGSIMGGTAVTLTGSGFTGAQTVSFGLRLATSFTVDSDTQITAIAPAQPAGTMAAIGVSTQDGGGMAHPFGYFTYVVPPELMPTVTSLAPSRGRVGGWSSVIITGTQLESTSAVRFGGLDAVSFSVDGSGTRIEASTPMHAPGIVEVELITARGRASAGTYTYVNQPAITNISPVEGSIFGGTAVMLTGSGFTGAQTVYFGLRLATSFTVDSDTQITAIAPPQPTGTVVMLDVYTQDVGPLPHPVGYFTYIAPPELRPTITGISPDRGSTAGQTPVVLTGTNLADTTAVRFGHGYSAISVPFTVDSGTRITIQAPPGAEGMASIELTTIYGVTYSGYLYVPPPSLTGVSPMEGSILGGTAVTLIGRNLTGATSVRFGNVAAASFTVDSDTQITAIAPPQPVGTTVMFDVVTSIGNMVHPIGYFTYVVPPELRPTLTSVAPRWNPPAGGMPVVLTGTNLAGTTAVTFAGRPAVAFTVDSATQVTAVPPPAPLDSIGLEITTGHGTVQGPFLYAVSPALTSASPASGPTAGGTLVTLRGSGLLATTGVSFGGMEAHNFIAVDDTRVDVVTPAHAAGGTAVQVETVSGTAVLGGAGFTFIASVVDGACGAADGQERMTAPSGAGLCSAGVAGSVAAAAGSFAWTCAGQGGGADSRRCSAPWPASGGGGLRTALALPDPAANQGWGLDSVAFDAALPAPLPPGASTQHRALRLVLSGGGAGTSAQFTVQYSEPVAAGAVYLKYGPSPLGLNCTGAACAQPHWYALPGSTAVFAPDRRSVTLTLTDGGLGDTDAVAGRITDPGMPVLLAGAGGAAPVSVPALGPAALAGLALALPLLGGMGRTGGRLRKKE